MIATTRYDDLVAQLDALDARLGDGKHLATLHDEETYYRRRQALARSRAILRDAERDLAEPRDRIDALTAARTALLAAQQQIDALIAAQPDWRTIGDTRTRDREWGRQQDLSASRKAIAQGVEFFGGVPAVPHALATILGEVRESDGRVVCRWPGSLPEIDQELARWRQRRAAVEEQVEAAIAQAEALLAETGTITR